MLTFLRDGGTTIPFGTEKHKPVIFLSMITSRILFCEAHHELGPDHGMGLAL